MEELFELLNAIDDEEDFEEWLQSEYKFSEPQERPLTDQVSTKTSLNNISIFDSFGFSNNDTLTIMLYDEDIKSQFPEFVSQMADCYQKNIMKSDNIS